MKQASLDLWQENGTLSIINQKQNIMQEMILYIIQKIIAKTYLILVIATMVYDYNRWLWFYSKDEITNFNAVIANTTTVKPFEHKAKVIEETVAQPKLNNNNGILKNAAIALS